MNKKEFAEMLREQLSKIMEGSEVKITEVLKTNGLVLTGIYIMTKDINITPTIYIDDFFESYKDGRLSFDEVLDKICNLYERNSMEESVDVSFFTNFSNVEGKIVGKLINSKENKELLSQVPHTDFLDLAIVYQVLVCVEGESSASILIRNEHMQMWEVDIDTIHTLAMRNTRELLGCSIKNMSVILKEMLSKEEVDLIGEMLASEESPMSVITNESKINGSFLLLYSDILAEFSDQHCDGKDLYILPSSIHECILLHPDEDVDVEVLRAMVLDVNKTQVREDEVLSNNVYYFSRKDNALSIA